jgi:hypothetical protein
VCQDLRKLEHPLNRRKTAALPQVAAPHAEVPHRELDPMKSDPIDDRDGAARCGPKPHLGVNKGHEKGKPKSG